MGLSKQRRQIYIPILDQNLDIFSDATDSEIALTIEKLSDQVEEALLKTKAPLSYKTVVLAALNLAEALVRKEAEIGQFKKVVQKKAEQALSLINKPSSGP